MGALVAGRLGLVRAPRLRPVGMVGRGHRAQPAGPPPRRARTTPTTRTGTNGTANTAYNAAPEMSNTARRIEPPPKITVPVRPMRNHQLLYGSRLFHHGGTPLGSRHQGFLGAFMPTNPVSR